MDEKFKNLTPQQIKAKYQKLDAPYSKKEIDKVNNLSDHFAMKLKKSKKTMSEALPIIDLQELMITEYRLAYGWIEDGYNKLIFKGSRGSAKTTFAVQYIILDMLLDNQSSWFVIMENKVQHSDTTMLEFKEWIDRIDLMWSGFANKWEKSDGQSIKEWRFRHNGNYQKVKFIGLDEAGKGTITPPANNYWRGFWVEEVQASDEQFGADMEKKAEKFNVLETLLASSIRYFNRAKEGKEFLRFLQFLTFNPYNDEDPVLEGFNKNHPDDEIKLRIYGFDYKLNREEDEVYITSNYKVNPYLPQEFLRFMERTERLRIGAWKTICLGMTGSPINTVYSNIFHIMDANQKKKTIYNTKGYTGFKNFLINIDVGNGGDGEMTIGLLGKRLNNNWVDLAEWGSGDYEKENGFDSEKLAIKLWEVIAEWNDHYIDFKKMNFVSIVMDYDPHFKAIFKKAFAHIEKQWKIKFKVSMFKDKFQKVFEKEKRPALVRYLISNGSLEIYKKYTPKTYSQLRATKKGKNGKIMDGNDDHRQRLMMGVFYIAKEIGRQEFAQNKLFDKDMLEFIKNVK